MTYSVILVLQSGWWLTVRLITAMVTKAADRYKNLTKSLFLVLSGKLLMELFCLLKSAFLLLSLEGSQKEKSEILGRLVTTNGKIISDSKGK